MGLFVPHLNPPTGQSVSISGPALLILLYQPGLRLESQIRFAVSSFATDLRHSLSVVKFVHGSSPAIFILYKMKYENHITSVLINYLRFYGMKTN